jgi:hypothetical protein
MTWTVRFYDETDTEVGWATMEPVDWWVDPSLPDSDRMVKYIESNSYDDKLVHDSRVVTDENGRPAMEMGEMIVPDERTPLQRTRHLGKLFVQKGYVDRYELADE